MTARRKNLKGYRPPLELQERCRVASIFEHFMFEMPIEGIRGLQSRFDAMGQPATA